MKIKNKDNLDYFIFICFKKFLIDNYVYSNLLKNYYFNGILLKHDKGILHFIKEVENYTNIMFYLFYWRHTIEGFQFWFNIHLKWDEYYYNKIKIWIKKL